MHGGEREGGGGGVVVNLGLSIFLLEVGDGGDPLSNFFPGAWCFVCFAEQRSAGKSSR